MSGISFWELVIIFGIGLIVLGPERLPRVANQLGTWLGQARRMTRVMKRQLEEELNLEKDFRLRPPAPTRALPEKPAHDDTYSPAHDAASAGTGVGDDAENDFTDTDVLEPEVGKRREEPTEPGAADRNA